MILVCHRVRICPKASKPVRGEAVRTIGVLETEPNDQDDVPDWRNQRQQYPPAAAIQIMKPTNGHRQAWQECGQDEDRVGDRRPMIKLSDRAVASRPMTANKYQYQYSERKALSEPSWTASPKPMRAPLRDRGPQPIRIWPRLPGFYENFAIAFRHANRSEYRAQRRCEEICVRSTR